MLTLVNIQCAKPSFSGQYSMRANTGDVAAEIKYDEPPKIMLVAPVVYPVDLLRNDVRGSAKVSVVLDDKGRVARVNVVDATDPAFGAATKAMMQSWRFTPAMKEKKPIATVFSIEQKFYRDERDSGVDPMTAKLLDLLAANSKEIYEEEALDSKPSMRYAPHPSDPRVSSADTAAGEVVQMEFFIDPLGNVQLPRIISAKNAEFGWAAATALKRWIFDVPTVKGVPVFARRELDFAFK